MTALPDQGRLAAVDYGTVRIGVAVCDPGQSLCSPYENYRRRTPALDADYFRRLTKEERIVGLVVGLPVFPSGDESPKSREAREFAIWLQEATGLPVALFDERYTSAIAEELMLGADLTRAQRKERRDKLAAQILLTAYLESQRKEQRPEGIG